MADLDQPGLRHPLERLADRRPGDAEHLGEAALAGQRLAGLEPAVDDLGEHLVEHLVGHGAAGHGLQRHVGRRVGRRWLAWSSGHDQMRGHGPRRRTARRRSYDWRACPRCSPRATGACTCWRSCCAAAAVRPRACGSTTRGRPAGPPRPSDLTQRRARSPLPTVIGPGRPVPGRPRSASRCVVERHLGARRHRLRLRARARRPRGLLGGDAAGDLRRRRPGDPGRARLGGRPGPAPAPPTGRGRAGRLAAAARGHRRDRRRPGRRRAPAAADRRPDPARRPGPLRRVRRRRRPGRRRHWPVGAGPPTTAPTAWRTPTSSSCPTPAGSPRVRNLLYAIEWWFFGGVRAFIWWRWIRDETPGGEADETQATSRTCPRESPPGPLRRPVASAA